MSFPVEAVEYPAASVLWFTKYFGVMILTRSVNQMWPHLVISTEDGSKECTNWHSNTPSLKTAIRSDKLAFGCKAGLPPGMSLKLSSQSAISRCNSMLRSCHDYFDIDALDDFGVELSLKRGVKGQNSWKQKFRNSSRAGCGCVCRIKLPSRDGCRLLSENQPSAS